MALENARSKHFDEDDPLIPSPCCLKISQTEHQEKTITL